MKDKKHDIIPILTYIIMAVLGWTIVFFIIIPAGCDILYPKFGFIVTVGVILLISHFVLGCFLEISFIIANIFFKK